MKKGICGISVLAILLGALFAPGGTKEATAAVGVNINIGPPPRYVILLPSGVVIPGTYVYAVPDIDVIFSSTRATGIVPIKAIGSGPGPTMGPGYILPRRKSLAS